MHGVKKNNQRILFRGFPLLIIIILFENSCKYIQFAVQMPGVMSCAKVTVQMNFPMKSPLLKTSNFVYIVLSSVRFYVFVWF